MNSRNNFGAGLLAFVGGMIAWAIIGPKVKEHISQSPTWQQIKREVEEEASRIKNITQEQYNKVVDEVTGKYSKVRRISNNELRDLSDDLKMHWNRIKTAWYQEDRSNMSGNEQM